MLVLLCITVGGLFAAGIYQMLRGSLVRLIIGLVLLGHAVNLLVFTAGGLASIRPPYVLPDGSVPPGLADPLPQALILTAIVIGFGTQAFAIVLIRRVYREVRTDDLHELRTTDVTRK